MKLHFKQVLKIKNYIILFKLLLSYSSTLLFNIVFSPLIFFILISKKKFDIKFGSFYASRIGSLSEMEVFLALQKKRKTINVLSFDKPVANIFLFKMFSREINFFFPNYFVKKMDQALKFFSRSTKFSWSFGQLSFFPNYKILLNTDINIKFTQEEIEKGKKMIRELGIKEKNKWICVHNRDDAYLKFKNPTYDYSYHSFRDFEISTMNKAIMKFIENGLTVVRVGSKQKQKINLKHEKLIDYPFYSKRNDFLDIFLLSHCEFCVGSDSGIITIPFIFRKPVYRINYGLGHLDALTYCYPWPLITKKIFDLEKNKYLNLKEIFNRGIDKFDRTEQFDNYNLKLIPNSEDEIRNLSLEINSRYNKTWQDNPEDVELQKKFWITYKKMYNKRFMGNIEPKIGTSFLRNNQYLLEQ